MLEAKLNEAAILKRLLEGLSTSLSCYRRVDDKRAPNTAAIKELVTDANFECNEEGIVRVIFHLCSLN